MGLADDLSHELKIRADADAQTVARAAEVAGRQRLLSSRVGAAFQEAAAALTVNRVPQRSFLAIDQRPAKFWQAPDHNFTAIRLYDAWDFGGSFLTSEGQLRRFTDSWRTWERDVSEYFPPGLRTDNPYTVLKDPTSRAVPLDQANFLIDEHERLTIRVWRDSTTEIWMDLDDWLRRVALVASGVIKPGVLSFEHGSDFQPKM